MELFNKYRPSSLKYVFGQEQAVKQLKDFLLNHELPHQLLFTGPSGTGKTTLARILRQKLDCGDRDFHEINCADFKGIDTVREVRARIGLAPIAGTARIYLIDEAHKLTNDAQNAMLKLIEKTPDHAYIFLATTEPNKLIRTIQTRVTEIRCKALSAAAMKSLLNHVLANEQRVREVSADVLDKIVEVADGAARKALVMLHQCLRHDDAKDQLESIVSNDTQRQALDLFKALMDRTTKWPTMIRVLNSIDEEPEGLRQFVLACCANEMINKFKRKTHNPAQAYLVTLAFSENFYDSRKAGLIASCYEVVSKNK